MNPPLSPRTISLLSTKMTSRSWAGVAIALVLSCNAVAQAATYVSTLGLPNDVYLAVEDFRGAGMPFRTDNNEYYLDNIVINLTMVGSEYNFKIGLYHTSGQWAPTGPELLSFSLPSSFSYEPEDVTLTPDTSFLLEANTSYILLITALDADSSFRWSGTQVTNGVQTLPGHLWTMYETMVQSLDSGESWSQVGGNGFRFIGGVNATAIPEPTALALVGLVLAGGAWRRLARGSRRGMKNVF